MDTVQMDKGPNAPASAVQHVVRTLGGQWKADVAGDSWVAEFQTEANRNSARLLIAMLRGWQSAPFHAGPTASSGLRVWSTVGEKD